MRASSASCLYYLTTGFYLVAATIVDTTQDGSLAPVLAANGTLTKQDQLEWISEYHVLPLQEPALQSTPNAWLAGSGQCAREYWDIADGVRQAVYDIYRMTTGNCHVVMGNQGSFYYKYYPIDGNCKSTIHQKTLAGALQAAVRALEGNQLCNTNLFRVHHRGTWHGDLLIGLSVSTWFTSARWTDYKGWLEAGNGDCRLHSWPLAEAT